jgi:hypothetical protein
MDDAERVRFAIANAERVHQEQLKRANDDY